MAAAHLRGLLSAIRAALTENDVGDRQPGFVGRMRPALGRRRPCQECNADDAGRITGSAQRCFRRRSVSGRGRFAAE